MRNEKSFSEIAEKQPLKKDCTLKRECNFSYITSINVTEVTFTYPHLDVYSMSWLDNSDSYLVLLGGIKSPSSSFL